MDVPGDLANDQYLNKRHEYGDGDNGDGDDDGEEQRTTYLEVQSQHLQDSRAKDRS